ncbi:MAG: hypothetical protein USCGTAYLOR_02805 [Chromatiales bacterium USCg_Taylor]|nr:MAG: hypothetical protein USCGTAYLOR_02805 [Chromatiales bacterium USCg_Taylor]
MIGLVRRAWLVLVLTPDGTKGLKEVPIEEYHALRWTLDAIRAGQGEDGAGPHAYQTDGATDCGRHTDALIASLRTGV